MPKLVTRDQQYARRHCVGITHIRYLFYSEPWQARKGNRREGSTLL
jgi:hypothetical protein